MADRITGMNAVIKFFGVSTSEFRTFWLACSAEEKVEFATAAEAQIN